MVWTHSHQLRLSLSKTTNDVASATLSWEDIVTVPPDPCIFTRNPYFTIPVLIVTDLPVPKGDGN